MLRPDRAKGIQGRTVLVTGAAGFIGSRLVEFLDLLGAKVIAVDALLETTYSAEEKIQRWQLLMSKLSSNVEFVEMDLRNSADVQTLPRVEIVFNLAAMPGLEKSWQDFEMYLSCNVTVTNNLIEYSKLNQVNRFVQASTSSVYGTFATGDENSMLRPTSPYGVTKLAAENLLLAHAQNFGLPYSILRYFSVFGPQQRPDMAFSIFANLIARDLEITIFGDGSQSRSNTYIDDVVISTIIAGYEPGFQNEIFNVCGNSELSVSEAVQIIGNSLKKMPKVKSGPERFGDQQKTRGDNSKLARLIDVSSFGNISELLAGCAPGLVKLK
jgi:nucleoside-diphosphate-sugar epimerase